MENFLNMYLLEELLPTYSANISCREHQKWLFFKYRSTKAEKNPNILLEK